MTTLRDLSKFLNLSVTQVSRALNNHSDVSEITRQRVHEAAKSLNYQPNLAARRLVTGRSGIVGFVLPSIPEPEDAAFALGIVGGLSRHFARNGMQFLLHISDDADDPLDVYRRLVSSGAIDGFLLVESVTNDPRIAYLRSEKVPFALHGRTVAEPDYPYFDIDNFGVAQRLTRYLLERGHERIAFLNGPTRLSFALMRLKGYQAALAEAGIRFRPELYAAGRMTEGFGAVQAIKMISGEARPTAVVAGNALIAMGIYRACTDLGLTVGRDISVVGHDDQLAGIRPQTFWPPMTCTSAPLSESWQPLADFLLGAIEGRPLSELQAIGEAVFIERDSAGPVKNPA